MVKGLLGGLSDLGPMLGLDAPIPVLGNTPAMERAFGFPLAANLPAGPTPAVYVKPGEHIYNTPLPPGQEMAFRQWVQDNKVPFDIHEKSGVYDMRGFYAALQSGDPKAKSAIDPSDKRMHYPDYWKTPLHPTFSSDSQWATPDAPHWTEDDELVDKDGNVVFYGARSPKPK